MDTYKTSREFASNVFRGSIRGESSEQRATNDRQRSICYDYGSSCGKKQQGIYLIHSEIV